ncbi:unnamed protein product [Ceutorhynchus assimilis]|uniref:Acid phosphatase n=1 Tax=Ceutorhynchus assimilis TaxID=467358 RepID=A0A9N9ME78_9CUCU|nr:unnamed protein product [Ceutorhynchus assimilis]
MLLLVLIVVFSLCNDLIQSERNPKQIHVLFRHGERSPTGTYPNDPHKGHKWEGGLGYLTNKGKSQMYSLGQNVRAHYENFLPRYYWPAEVNFTSSQWDRCLMSAELFGAGLFPPHDFQIWNSDVLWQPIPVHYLPRNLDNLVAMKTNCTKYDKQFIEVQNSAKVQQYNQDYADLYNYLSQHTGKIINNIEDVESLFNTLEIYQLNNLSTPYWVNDTLMNEMKIIAAQNLAIYSETEYMKKIKGGFFLKTILDLMETALNGTKDVPTINTYSGHDLTIVHVMRALNLIDTLKPNFGACLIFELYEDSTIKVFYWDKWNGKIIEQILPNCASPCTVSNFIEGYKAVLPVNWARECEL